MKYRIVMCWAALWCAIGGLYKYLWRHTFGRPWTYVIREWAHRNPLQAILLLPLFIAGAIVAQWKLPHLYVILPSDFLFFLMGHLFWDTVGAYIKKRRDLRSESTGHLQNTESR